MSGRQGRVESKRFEMDPATAGLWERVRGDLHSRLQRNVSNAEALDIVSRLYFDLERRDPEALTRSLERLQLEERGYRV
jgi:hypothetical protein